METPEEILNRLTDAQKDAIRFGQCSLSTHSSDWSPECICNKAPITEELCAFKPALAYKRKCWPDGIVLTPLGVKIKNLLILIPEGWIPWDGGECPVPWLSKPGVLYSDGVITQPGMGVAGIELWRRKRVERIQPVDPYIIAYKPETQNA